MSDHQPPEGMPELSVLGPRRRRRHRRGRLLARIAGGGGVLLLLVMTLISLHYDGRSMPAHSQEPWAVRSTVATTEDTAPDGATAAATDAKIHVFIQHTANEQSAKRARELAAFLEERGYAVADIRAVEFKIDRPSVRFYFDRDRPGSENLLRVLGAFFADRPGQAPDYTIDLTHSPQKPEAGAVEVWIANS